ncbi:hypothetical protein M422DRAFT_276118 [Sphaerobolus stellatus SS14]|uniref:NADP-dependent oxidoreductase domain-containing protein n=1 Tax=Sphaerobolus stellatus (strain SS14) TaxID=990650 RepID=A0A0C9TN83_SPHS4|nr:hypothetical protein M422DRAFT_276118 [Sphaerobolus stellatus SS14]
MSTPTKTSYPTRQLGKKGPQVSAIGLGAMAIGAFYGPTDKEESMKMLSFAADRGVTFWDTSDIYGDSEETIGKWFATTGRRSEIFLASKFGAWNPDGSNGTAPNSKPSYIKKAVERSLKNLQTSTIDLYYQHRVDPDVPIEVVVETLGELIEAGKIRYIGLSECNADTLRRAVSVPKYGEKVVAVQKEFGPFSLDLEKGDFLKTVDEFGIAVVAYSPLNRGLVTGRFRSRADFDSNDWRLTQPRFSEENFPKNLPLIEKFQSISSKAGFTPAQVCLAWILVEYPNFIPIPGSRNISRLDENAKSAEIKLEPEYVKQIRQFANEADNAAGTRYAEGWIPEGKCIPREQWKGE